jgi:ABC-type antimicrobial peptide transport system permease subunit
VLGLVVWQGLSPVVIGIVVGALAAIVSSRVLRQMLYAVTPLDAVTFLLVPTVVLVTAAIACGIPAWRATRVDPLIALRGE